MKAVEVYRSAGGHIFRTTGKNFTAEIADNAEKNGFESIHRSI
jgi:hypothetical protein